MKFSLRTLFGFLAIAALALAAMNGQIWCYGLLHTLAIFSFLAAVLIVIYSESKSSPFAGGWAICGGVTLVLAYLNVSIFAGYLPLFSDPFYSQVIDLAFTFVAAYAGGMFAQSLRAGTEPSPPSEG